MKFTLVIYTAPFSHEASSTALRFAKTLIDEGHEIYRLFFFSDGVHNTSRMAVAAQDEVNIPAQWHDLISRYELDSVACVSSAIKRGILDEKESARHELDATTIHSSSEIGGLGQFIDANINSDRIISFG
jgi:tRNA 2-thiouridine synthesizing protein D